MQRHLHPQENHSPKKAEKEQWIRAEVWCRGIYRLKCWPEMTFQLNTSNWTWMFLSAPSWKYTEMKVARKRHKLKKAKSIGEETATNEKHHRIWWGGKQRERRSREIWRPGAYRRTGDTWTMRSGRGRRWKTRGLIEILFKEKWYPKSLEAKGPPPLPRRRVTVGEQDQAGCSDSREGAECCSESERWPLNLCLQPHS